MRRDGPIQRIRSEIRSISPAHRAILVYANLGEQGGIAKGFKDRPEEPCGEINFSAPPIVKQQVKGVTRARAHAYNSVVLFQRCDKGERVALLTPDPIVARLLPMKLGPIENQPKCPAGQLSINDFQRLDPDLRFVLAYTAWKCGGG